MKIKLTQLRRIIKEEVMKSTNSRLNEWKSRIDQKVVMVDDTDPQVEKGQTGTIIGVGETSGLQTGQLKVQWDDGNVTLLSWHAVEPLRESKSHRKSKLSESMSRITVKKGLLTKMKITISQLRRIIREEVYRTINHENLNEGFFDMFKGKGKNKELDEKTALKKVKQNMDWQGKLSNYGVEYIAQILVLNQNKVDEILSIVAEILWDADKVASKYVSLENASRTTSGTICLISRHLEKKGFEMPDDAWHNWALVFGDAGDRSSEAFKEFENKVK